MRRRRIVDESDEITKLLEEWRNGNSEAENDLFRLVFPKLRQLAQYYLSREARNRSMQATELVDEIYFRMVAAKDRDWQNRGHFFAIAARVMRRHLIDLARRQPDVEFASAGGIEHILKDRKSSLDTAITIDRLLNQLAATRPLWCNVVELKYFLGLTNEETAEALGIGVRTMQREWRDARNWLYEQLNGTE